MSLCVIFSHGQESGPWGTKITAMSDVAKKMNCDVKSIDYRGIKDPCDRVKKLNKEIMYISTSLVLVGSSMGGYVATAASNHPNVKGLFVLAPAYYIEGFDHSLIDSVSVPFEIVHGWYDDVVPVENSIRFAQSEHANLHILNGNHGLTENLDDINLYFQQFLKRIQ
tara:strand:- start:455 stop:955 length:501 start_codon:yes stop_codon:yes gene_type:complete